MDWYRYGSAYVRLTTSSGDLGPGFANVRQVVINNSFGAGTPVAMDGSSIKVLTPVDIS